MTQCNIARFAQAFYNISGHNAKIPLEFGHNIGTPTFLDWLDFTNQSWLLRGRKYFTQAISFDERAGGGCAAASL